MPSAVQKHLPSSTALQKQQRQTLWNHMSISILIVNNTWTYGRYQYKKSPSDILRESLTITFLVCCCNRPETVALTVTGLCSTNTLENSQLRLPIANMFNAALGGRIKLLPGLSWLPFVYPLLPYVFLVQYQFWECRLNLKVYPDSPYSAIWPGRFSCPFYL